MRIRWIGRQSLLLAFGLAVGAVAFRGGNFLERLFLDLRFVLLSSAQVQERQSDAIAIITMDAASETALSLPYGPDWRQFYPAIIRTLGDAGASLIVFDSMFLESEPPWDSQLGAAVASAGNVVAGEDGVRMTTASLRSSFLAIGDLNATLIGGKPRFVRLDPREAPALEPLSVVAAAEYLERTGRPEARSLSGRSRGFWINYREPFGYFPVFSFADVLNAGEGRIGDAARTPLSLFAGRIVLLGLDDPMKQSDRFTYPNMLGGELPGVYGHAYATETILQDRPLTRSSPWVDAGVAAVFIVILLLCLEIRARRLRAVLVALLPGAVFILYLVLLSRLDLWLGYAPLFAAFWAVLIPHWTLVRMSLSSSLSRAMGFDPQLVEGFRRERDRSGRQVTKEVTIVIADVRDYTRFVSRAGPGTASRVMADYLASMERCVTAYGGYVNKYVGDEIIAVFGFPLAPEQTALRAVRAATAMLHELGRLRVSWKKSGLDGFERIGIGIDTGTVAFAEVGGRSRSQFDIIGDCVNGASRIEHLTKEFGTSLLVSEETWRALEGDARVSGSFRLVQSVMVRGQRERKVFGLAG